MYNKSDEAETHQPFYPRAHDVMITTFEDTNCKMC